MDKFFNQSFPVDHQDFINENKPLVLVLAELEAFQSYYISLAFVTIDVGAFSTPIINRTTIDVPSSPPSNITVTFNATKMKVSWEHLPREKWNGPGTGYNVTITETLLYGGFYTRSFLAKKTNNMFEQSELHPYTDYNVGVSSCTRVGCSYSNFQYFKTLEAGPCPPSNISRIESIKNKLCIQWTKIERKCENGILQNFMIYVKQIIKDPYEIERSLFINTSSVDLQYCIENVPLGRIYNISIAGQTGGGIGNSSKDFATVFGIIVNGNWAEWTKWSPCTRSCDSGRRSRKRFCSDPAPVNGLPCFGHNNETADCVLPRCEGVYLAPPGQLNCSLHCGTLKLRCSSYIYTENNTHIFNNLALDCSRLSDQLQSYAKSYHPSYDTAHNVCEGFVMKNSSYTCQAVTDRTSDHIQRLCNCLDPASEGLTEWNSWSPCLSKCNASLTRTRTRSCTPRFQCSENAKLVDEQTCGLPPCPIDGLWSDWQESTQCSKTCDGGYKVKVRTCTNPPPAHGGAECRGPSEDEGEVCNPQPCPVDRGWSLWTEWSSCNNPCGMTKQVKQRFCNNPLPKYRGIPCSSFRQVKERNSVCNLPPCQEMNVILTCQITNREWHYTMYKVHSKLAVELRENVCKNIYSSQSNISNVMACEFSNIRSCWKSSCVIPTIHLRYSMISSYQVVSFWDQMIELSKINNLTVDDCHINTTLVPYRPLEDIVVSIVNKTSVNITWKIAEKQDAQFVYVFYIEDEKTDKDDEWHIFGTETSQDTMFLHYLKPEQLYRAYMVLSNSYGNGIPSQKFYIQTVSSPPSVYPFNVKGFAVSSTSIYLTWNPIPEDFQNGLLIAYYVKYKQLFESEFKIKIVSRDLKSCTLTDLQPYTYYHIDVSGVNLGGEGPADYAMVKTLEGVPSVQVPDVEVNSFQSISWWSVSWSPLPKDKIHGILRGYKLKYYLSYKSDVPIGREIEWIVRTFDKFTFYHKETNLESYGTYNLTVTGFTSVGEGPTPEHFAKTCRCQEHLFAQWTVIKPYTELISASNITGLFPDLIHDSIINSCGSCAEYKQSILHMYSTKYGDNPRKRSDYELKLSINDDVDVSFPYYERISTQAIVPGSIFLPIIKSTGCAFITRDEVNLNELVINLILNVVKVWPLLVVSYAIASLFGILIWSTDQFSNPYEFTLGSSKKGPCIGFWFSFVTMTTVGYGDLTPRSKIARALSIVWFLMGLVLNGIIVGFITTAMTSLDQPDTAKLYNTKTATLNRSYEYRLAVRRSAVLPDKQYSSIDAMLDDLQDKKVDAILLDLFSMVGYKDKISSRFLKVKTILDTQTAYGIILSGQSVHLKNDIESRMSVKQNVVTDFKKSIEEDVPTLSEEKRGDVMQLVFGADSAIFKETIILLSIILAILIFIGFVYEMGRQIRSRMKVHVQDDPKLSSFECEVENFVDNVTNNLESMMKKQEKEIVDLAVLTFSIKRYEETVGKDETWARIRHLWDG